MLIPRSRIALISPDLVDESANIDARIWSFKNLTIDVSSASAPPSSASDVVDVVVVNKLFNPL